MVLVRNGSVLLIGIFFCSEEIVVLACFVMSQVLGCWLEVFTVWIRCGCRRYGMLQSFFSHATAPHTFLRESPLTEIVSGSAGSGRRGFIDCEFLTGKSTQFKGSC